MLNRILLLIVIIGASFIVYLSVSGMNKVENTASVGTTSPSITVSQPLSPTQSPQVPSDWKSYDSEAYSFSFKYDPKFTIRPNADNTLTLYLHGPSQSLGTEVYDGIILNFQEATYTENSFKAFVDTTYENIKSQESTQSISPITETSVGSFKGYEFTYRSFGEAKHTYLDLGNKRFVYITALVEDPKNQGFEAKVVTLLSTLRPR